MSRRPNPGKNRNLSQFGLLDIPDLDDGDQDMDLSDDDMDFEAELAALSGGGGRKPRPKKPAAVPAAADLDAMIAASLKDVPSDDEGSGSDDDDPDLLSELQELAIDDEEAPPPRTSRPAPAPPVPTAPNSTVSLLQERIANYTLAEKTAKEKGESSRARRFGRGIKTLNDLLKQAKAGKPINDADIPPAVAMGAKSDPTPPIQPSPPVDPSPPKELSPPEDPSPPPVPPRRQNVVDSPEPSSPEPVGPPPAPPVEALSPERQQGLQLILNRQHEFKAAALSSKQAGDKTTALEYLKVVKQFDIVVDAYKSGQDMDLNELPTVDVIAAALKAGGKEENTVETSTEPSPAPEEAPGQITASSLDEALRQRLAYFQKQEAKAKEEGNSSKARRMGRIVKQYTDAVKLNAAGKPVPVDELPPAPGHAPLNEFSSPASHPSPPAPHSAPAPRPAPARPSPAPSRPTSTRYEKQLAFLLLRQKQFKEAAIKAKKEGNIAQAKEYLRSAKGFDALIESARGGLAVDLKSLPLPPKEQDNLEHAFEEVSKEDCDPSPTDISSSDDDVTSRLHAQLATQLKLCRTNMEHYNAMGNIAEMNRFQHLAASVKQDMDLCALATSLGQTPKFHYETRKFSIVQCNTDLNENDLELTIVRGISYNVPNPKEIDTYVKFEFAYPQEAPVSDRTSTVNDTNSPTYNATFPLTIHRSSRACQRYFKRHGIKLEVYSKGGWFRGDTLLGVVNVKLARLETQVTLHEAFSLMDGRRPAGGSLEVKVRVRTPLVQQQIEHQQQRWLVIED